MSTLATPAKLPSGKGEVIDINLILHDNYLYCENHRLEVCDKCNVNYADVNLMGEAFRKNNGKLPPPNPSLTERINKLKAQGNDYFKHKSYDNSIEAYTEAINLSRKRPVWDTLTTSVEEISVLLSNRAASFIEKKFFVNALYDAEIVTRIRSSWPKGHFRKGRALYELGRYGEAVDAFKKANALDPESKDINESLKNALDQL